MKKVEKIEAEVRSLSGEELAAFREWFGEFDDEVWDREFEADARSRRFDSLANRALDSHRSGDSTPL